MIIKSIIMIMIIEITIMIMIIKIIIMMMMMITSPAHRCEGSW